MSRLKLVPLFSSFGPDILSEIRACWARIDEYPHVHTFLDMHDVGDQLLQTCFIDPVVDCERLTITYPSLDKLLQEIIKTGSHNLAAGRRQGLTGKRAFNRFRKLYANNFQLADNRVFATVEVVYALAWG